MKIVVTGATGFLGFRTIEYLIDQPSVNKIIATGRKFSYHNKVENDKVTYHLGDLNDAGFVDKLCSEVDIDAIVNCASLSSPWGRRADFVKANVDTQSNLIRSAEKYSIKKFIYISSPSIYFELKDKYDIKESDPLPNKMINHYAETKVIAEGLLGDSKLSYIILRPRALSGRGDTVIMPRLLRSHSEGRLRMIGDGNNLVDLTSVYNVAHAIWCSINANDDAVNQAYNITNGKPVKLWDFINSTLVALDLQPVTNKISPRVLMLVAKFMEFKSKIGGYKIEPILTQYSVGVLSQNTTLDISKARRLLSYHPIQSLEESITEFVDWWKLNLY